MVINTMKKIFTVFLVLVSQLSFAEAAKLYKFSADEVKGNVFQTDRAEEDNSYGAKALNVDSMLSSDEKFSTGMYKTGPVFEDHREEAYGVDEFMFFLEGGVTLTSTDGTVTVVKAGEALSIPKEWKGTWKSDGYMKLWVIYSASGE